MATPSARCIALSRKSGSVMRIITLEDLRRHALNVWGKDDGIEWVSEVFMPTANHETGTLRLHPIKSEAAYAVALHEIGHLRQGPGEDVLLDEPGPGIGRGITR